MRSSVDCISIGSRDRSLLVDRVIEYLLYAAGTPRVDIWLDLFLRNTTDAPGMIRFLHRGNLVGHNVTWEGWSGPNWLTERLIRLHDHAESEPVLCSMSHGKVVILRRTCDPTEQVFVYDRWDAAAEPVSVIGGRGETDIPFTLWELGPFEGKGGHLARVHLELTGDSYRTQVKEDGAFYICGEALLLEMIEREDIPAVADEALRQRFASGIQEFRESYQTTPSVYEIVLVGTDEAPLPAKALRMTGLIEEELVPDELRTSTMWFTAAVPDWMVQGELGRVPTNLNDFRIVVSKR